MTTLTPDAATFGEAGARALGRIGTAVARGMRHPSPARPAHRTGAPVRRDSLEAGTFEDAFFAVPAKGETDHLLRVARRALDAGRRLRRVARSGERALTASERLVASLTAGAVRVYEELLTLARLNRGRVYPSYDHLAHATGLGRATVARALATLEGSGFLVRQRRFARVAGDTPLNGGAARYAQTSNAYRPILPRAVLPHLPRWLRPAPLPDDVIQRAREHDAEQARMRAQLSCRELARVTVGGALGRMLERLGAAIDARDERVSCESHSEPQPRPDSIRKGINGIGLDGR